MRKLQFWVSASLLVAAIATFTIFTGCEDEPGLSNAGALLDTNAFENETRIDGEIPLLVSPIIENVAVIGQHISFRAKGAVTPVAWSVASAARGTISTVGLRTDYALYESIVVADNTIVAIDAVGRSATATIRVGADPLTIIPTDITLARPPAGPAANFVVSGGVPPYSSWTELFPELGVVSQGGTYYVMNPTLVGTNIVTISDAAGDIASATVSHVLDLDALSIVPSSTTLSTDGEEAIFIGTGGLSPYSWSVVYPTRGEIVSGATADLMTYRRQGEGDQIIVLEDSAGETTQATITQSTIATLTIVPSPATMSSNQTVIVLSAVGGAPTYQWSVPTATADGNFAGQPAAQGASVVFSRTSGSGSIVVKLIDRIGSTYGTPQTAYVIITKE
ncbi:MAG: hypothetical protein HN919_13320 [Verrucomicrobia bacterium]|jgi:hypothetical protein|nr:hypothetical protein [Verrucomicrobiota bacterium]MBT7067280.1 hypothetical protein [Verrucomicrobiota bacterium]MBT7698678.1 hypothetical protein [Verrucomicrobiota bacterium]